MTEANKPKKILNATQIEKRFNVIRTAVAILIALSLVFILILSASKNPFHDFSTFLFGPLQNVNRFSVVITKFIPLLFTGTAVCLVYSCAQINLASEGSFFAGAFATVSVAILPNIFPGLHPLLCILVGGLAGAVFTGIPAVMHVKFKVMTVVSSLMINYVSQYLGLYLVLNVFRDPEAGFVASYKFAESAKLPKIIPGTDIHLGLIIGLLVVIGCYYLLYHTTFGYSARMIGINQKFARFSGINVERVIVAVSLLSGFVAGVGGSVEVLGLYSRFNYTGLTNHGWDGIMMAVIARNDPKYVPFAALFLAYIRTAADVLNRMSSLPTELVKIIQAVIIIFICARKLLYKAEHNAIILNSKKAIANQAKEI